MVGAFQFHFCTSDFDAKARGRFAAAFQHFSSTPSFDLRELLAYWADYLPDWEPFQPPTRSEWAGNTLDIM